MKGSYSLGRVFGIRIAVHVTFALVLIWAGWLGFQERALPGALWAVALVLLLFFCVVLHELGHSLVAQRFGVTVRSITLLPIGGVAMMSRIPERPVQEFLIAVAGPLVNVVIFGLLWLSPIPLLPIHGHTVFPVDTLSLVQRIAWANAGLVLFNLLPAFPMDGGRILRSLLAMRLPYLKATRIASVVGQVMAFGFLCLGLTGSPVLVLVAVFVFLGARGEARMQALGEALRGVRARDLMATAFDTVDAADPIWHCRVLAANGFQEGYPVLQEGRLVGLLRREDLGAGAEPAARAEEAMQRRFISYAPSTEMRHGWQDVLGLPQHVFPVLAEGRRVGIITRDRLQAFLQARRPLSPPPLPPSAANRRGWRIDLG